MASSRLPEALESKCKALLESWCPGLAFAVELSVTVLQVKASGPTSAFIDAGLLTQAQFDQVPACGVTRKFEGIWILTKRKRTNDWRAEMIRGPLVDRLKREVPELRLHLEQADGKVAARARLQQSHDTPLPRVNEGLRSRERVVGRYQRLVRWFALENVIWPDWREVRNGFSAGSRPRSA